LNYEVPLCFSTVAEICSKIADNHSAKTPYTYKPKACHVSGRPWGKNGRSKFGVRMGLDLVDNDGSNGADDL
jgi:hypothetical protein